MLYYHWSALVGEQQIRTTNKGMFMVRLPIGSEPIWISPVLQRQRNHRRPVVDFVICPSCGVSVGRTSTMRAKGRRFCSQACHGAASSRRVARQCKQCGVAFMGRRTSGNRGWGVFCSNECQNQYQRDNAELLYYTRKQANCRVCGKVFYYHPRSDSRPNAYFCSHVCSWTFQKGKAKRSQGSRSGYRGVYFRNGNSKKWAVEIRHLKKTQYFGSYDDPEDAARVYDREAKRLHGEDAILSFPEGKDEE